MNRTAIVHIDHSDFNKTRFELLKSKQGKDDIRQDVQMSKEDRFYFNQYFPLKAENLNDDFLESHVKSVKNRTLLKDLSQQKCELYGIIGRRAFHIFDKTHMVWICNSKKLGYIHLADLYMFDDDDSSDQWTEESENIFQ